MTATTFQTLHDLLTNPKRKWTWCTRRYKIDSILFFAFDFLVDGIASFAFSQWGRQGLARNCFSQSRYLPLVFFSLSLYLFIYASFSLSLFSTMYNTLNPFCPLPGIFSFPRVTLAFVTYNCRINYVAQKKEDQYIRFVHLQKVKQ